MYIGLLLCAILVVTATFLFNSALFNYTEIAADKFFYYDNSHVVHIRPPVQIDIESNELECHKTPTRCTSNADCQLCRESLAACVQFNETVLLELDEDRVMTINAGESYCLALDGEHSRSCNPATGTWILRQVNNDNFALICHCDYPGIATQINIYDDCTVAVGCKPNGFLTSVYTTPFSCTCDDGYVSETSDTGVPYCRPNVIRDIILDPGFFHRPPCNDGFVPLNHPALHRTYFTQVGANVCVPDPCSIDPLTGVKHSGRVLYEPEGGADGSHLIMCVCDINDNLYPVYSAHSMLNTMYTDTDAEISNACIQPLLVDRRTVRSDLKVFWARNSLKSDADIVFQVNPDQVHDRYKAIMYPRLTPHPTDNVATRWLLKFELHSAYTAVSVDSAIQDIFQRYWNYNYLRVHNDNNCPIPGIGECRPVLTCGNVTCTRNPCIGSTVNTSYRSSCYFFRTNRTFTDVGTIGQIAVWNNTLYYAAAKVPVTFWINARMATDFGYGFPSEFQTIYFTSTEETLPESEYDNARHILNTYPLYAS